MNGLLAGEIEIATTLAQSGSAGSGSVWVIGGVGVIIALAIGGFVLVRVARSRYVGSTPDSETGGFTLQDLREMRDDGRLSEEEYRAAREVLLGTAASETPIGKAAAESPDDFAASDAPDESGEENRS